MTEQQPQEPYGDPQYESYREGTPTESVPTISMPTESIPITGASGPTGASRQRQAPQPHTPIRILFSRAASHIRAVCARPFPDS